MSFVIRIMILILLLCLLSFNLRAASPDAYLIKGVEGELAQNIQSRLKEAQNESDIHNQIAEALYPYGYFSPSIDIKGKEIFVNLGPLTRITSFSLEVIGEGKYNFKILKAAADFPLQKGQVFNSLLYEKGKQDLIIAAEKEGYLHASFDKAQVLIHKQDQTARIKLVFNSRFRFYFGKVQFNETRLSQDLL